MGWLIARSCVYSENTKRFFVRDAQGRALVLKGFNANGDAKGDSLRVGKADLSDFQRMADEWGCNWIRFLVFWGSIEPEPGLYDTSYMERVKERLDWCEAAGLYVVLDMHQDLYTWRYGGDGAPEWAIRHNGEPFELQSPWEKNYLQPAVIASIRNFWIPENGHGELQDHYIGAFMRLAEHVKGHPALLGFDLYNEPVLATREFIGFEDKFLHPFYQRLIDSLRTVDEDSWLFYEPMAMGPNQGFRSGLGPLNDPRKGDPRLVYYPHIYTLDLDLTGKYIGFPLFTSAWAAKRNREVRRHKVPLCVGEFGLDNTRPSALKYLESVMKVIEKTGSGWAYWDYGKGGSWVPLDKEGKEKPMLDVLVRPYPQRTAGTPKSYGYHRKTGKFWLHYYPNTEAADSTIIFIPERSYPNGWEFDKHAPAEGTFRWDEMERKLYLAPVRDNQLQKLEIRRV